MTCTMNCNTSEINCNVNHTKTWSIYHANLIATEKGRIVSIDRSANSGTRHTAIRTPSEDNWSIGLFFNLSDLGSLGLEFVGNWS